MLWASKIVQQGGCLLPSLRIRVPSKGPLGRQEYAVSRYVMSTQRTVELMLFDKAIQDFLKLHIDGALTRDWVC